MSNIDKKLLAVECAMLDLIGAMQAHEQGDSNIHDWKSHELTINELIAAFNLEDPREEEEEEEE